MTAIRSTFLRRLIAADAAACVIGGIVFAFDAAWLGAPLGLPEQLLQPVGLFLIAYGLGLAALATRPTLPRALVWALVAVNVLWAIESVGLVLTGFVAPTTLGLGVVLAQAAGALLVGDLQFLSLRRARREVVA